MTIDQQTLDRVVKFHAHPCPGLTMGLQAAAIALREISPHSKDEEVVAWWRSTMCGADAIQVLSGCTFGKGNLVHEDWGKNALHVLPPLRRSGRTHRRSARWLAARPGASGAVREGARG